LSTGELELLVRPTDELLKLSLVRHGLISVARTRSDIILARDF